MAQSDPSDAGIELTEAMIEAGIDAYYGDDFDPGSPFSLRATIERIYRAMHARSLATKEGRVADAGRRSPAAIM